MVIGIDIDDVITSSSELITEYAMRYFKSNDIDLINNILHGYEINDELMDFYNKYLIELYQTYRLKDNVKEVINRLRAKKHKIILITARGNSEKNKLLENINQIDVTKEYLKKHQINYDKIIFKAMNKKAACLENNLDIMIDDSSTVLNSLQDTNIKTILYASIGNKQYQNDFETIHSWLELENCINRINENK